MSSKNPRINFHITEDDIDIAEKTDDFLLNDAELEEAHETLKEDVIVLPKEKKRPRPKRTDIFDVEEPEPEPAPVDEPVDIPDEELDYGVEGGMTFEAEVEPQAEQQREPLLEPLIPKEKPKGKAEQPKGKLTKSGKPRKPMSEAHKAKLAEARVKAMQAKRQKALERKANKEIEKEEKELLKKKKVKDLQKLKDEVNDVVKPTPLPAGVSISKEDLERIQYDAIVKYDTLRKQQKAEKKKLQEEERQRKELMNKLKPQTTGYRSKNANGRLNNRYDMCY